MDFLLGRAAPEDKPLILEREDKARPSATPATLTAGT
jgi:hypothetical protein